jgi:hypothetical protein
VSKASDDSRTAEARQHDQTVSRDLDINALEVVLAGAADADRVFIGGGGTLFLGRHWC